MKHRVLVMNGQRIIQNEAAPGEWKNAQVDKAHSLKPGIYNLYLAKPADKTAVSEGVIVHADASSVYQQIGKQYVMHARASFDKVPDIGSAKSISYDPRGQAVVASSAPKLSRGISR